MSEQDATAGPERIWETEAENWVRWTRTPGHDVFPYFAPVFLDQILTAGRGLTLEIGCGEGRVARELTARGHRVVGLEPSPTLARYARAADGASAYLNGDGTRLPFVDAAFDTVVAYNALQTMAAVDDMARTVREAGRVVRPAGHFCVCFGHPFTDVTLVSQASGADGESAASYFEQQRVDSVVTKDGLTMRFSGWTYTLEDYVRALEDAGFVIERIREPRPDAEDAAQRPNLVRWRGIPLFLMLRAVKAT